VLRYGKIGPQLLPLLNYTVIIIIIMTDHYRQVVLLHYYDYYCIVPIRSPCRMFSPDPLLG
jgi:hypothetical protein